LLRLLVLGIASNKRRLRSLESLSRDMTPKMHRTLGLKKRRVSDTTFYELLARIEPAKFGEVVAKQLRQDLDRKAITNDRFSGGVMSYDGKCVGTGFGDRPNAHCQRTFWPPDDRLGWRLLTLRSSLTSSSARPIVNQIFIPRKRGEATMFPLLFKRDVKQFPKLFRYVTADAGITSKRNAQIILAANKDYVFAVKGNQPQLYAQAQEAFRRQYAVCREQEHTQGKTIRRFLHRVDVSGACDFPGAKQLWRLTTSVKRPGKGLPKITRRYYVTSASMDVLSPQRIMRLIRLHWGIENGPHWTLDVMFSEDRHCPCKTGFGPTVMSWLNVIAYNLVSVFRAHLPKEDHRRPPWRRLIERIYQVMLVWDPGETNVLWV
jgi:predicted transposase YbfD/YdcC